MSKLESYYSHKALITDNDNQPDTNNQAWENMEEKLIREEVMPELMQKIAPVLAKVKTPLSININYNPEGVISLNFTRNCLQMQIPVNGVVSHNEHVIEEEPFEAHESIATVQEEAIATSDDIEVLETENEDVTSTEEKSADLAPKKKAKSVGFSVSFSDGTVIHEKKAVKTWIKTLQKIGLDNIINNQRKHEAWHTVDGKNICIVDRVQTVRSSDNNSPQEYIGGYYVMTQLSNSQKVKDIESLGKLWPKLKLKIIWDETTTEEITISDDTEVVEKPKTPKIDQEAKYYNYPIIEQARNYMSQHVAERTANSYISNLDNAVRRYISEKIDSNADSIFSYTTVEDVTLIIDMLNLDDDFLKENESRHNSMSAALNQYLKFIQSRI